MLLNRFRRFFGRENGNVAMIVAIAMMPMALSAGVAIDLVRAHLAKTSLQQAMDAAGLASGSDYDTDNGQVLNLAQQYLNANVQGLKIVTPKTKIDVVEKDGIKKVDIKATAEMETTFLKLVNVNKLEVSIDSTTQRKEAGPLQVALVLDTTGSMTAIPKAGGVETKIESLRAAASSLVNELLSEANPQAKVGVVPYSATVKVIWGSQASDPKKVPAWVKAQKNISGCAEWAKEYPDRDSCIKNMGKSFESCVVDGILRSDVNCCKDVCVKKEERTFGFTGCVGPRVLDKNGDYSEAFLRTIDSPYDPPYPGMPQNMAGCAPQRLLELTNNKKDVLDRIAALTTNGDTFIPSGLTWGWNVLDQQEIYPSESLAEIEAKGGRKVLVLMTDGINALKIRKSNTDKEKDKGDSNVGWLEGTSDPAEPNALTLDLCTNIKKSGIQIFTVLFDVNDMVTEEMLKNCATNASMAFKASDGKGLKAAFGSIGNQLRTVKLTE